MVHFYKAILICAEKEEEVAPALAGVAAANQPSVVIGGFRHVY